MREGLWASFLCVACVHAAIDADEVTHIPGFVDADWNTKFKVYSGLLDVPGPFPVTGIEYDSLRIHYQFHTSQAPGDPSTIPLMSWLSGGPGETSVQFGLYAISGAFRVDVPQNFINPWAWNKMAHMLYMDLPAGVGGSECIKDGKAVEYCIWDDKTQAEAYAHCLKAFLAGFPEYKSNKFVMAGESYFGQYGPNNAKFILDNAEFKSLINLKAIVSGNSCWAGTDSLVGCMGKSVSKPLYEFYYGRGLISKKLKDQIDEKCIWPTTYTTNVFYDPTGFGAGGSSLSKDCLALLQQGADMVGPHIEYDIYDPCPLDIEGKLKQNPSADDPWPHERTGGSEWGCYYPRDAFMADKEVQKALHIESGFGSVMSNAFNFDPITEKTDNYTLSGPASVTIYPSIGMDIDVLIHSGDVDGCVPYVSTMDMFEEYEASGTLVETSAWTPWYVSDDGSGVPSGYKTEYKLDGSSKRFHFQTLRLSGHDAGLYRPEGSLVMISRFINSIA